MFCIHFVCILHTDGRAGGRAGGRADGRADGRAGGRAGGRGKKCGLGMETKIDQNFDFFKNSFFLHKIAPNVIIKHHLNHHLTTHITLFFALPFQLRADAVVHTSILSAE